MKLRIASSASAMDELRPLWERLFAADPAATLFQSFSWNRLAAECFAERERPHVIAAESQSGAAIIPAAIGREGLTLLGDALFDYRDVLWEGDAGPLRAAWATLAGLQLPLHITAIRGQRACRRWAQFNPRPFVRAPQVRHSDVSAADFSSAHAGLRRALRRLERQGVSLHHHCGSEVGLVRWIYCQKAVQFEGSTANLFADPRRVDFTTAACALEGGACDVFTLQKGVEIVAALVTFRDRRTRRFYTVYFDPAWARYSPGVGLIFAVAQRSLAEGLDCDFMTGEQPHKTRFMTSSVPLYIVHASADALVHASRVQETELAA